mmetsp:Transcript_38273/g.108198  ORF Transcript_38273/g.108198 Transcript_38273/m.108198 type:complete len:172 (-) Transcript_38273:627-1142(-)
MYAKALQSPFLSTGVAKRCRTCRPAYCCRGLVARPIAVASAHCWAGVRKGAAAATAAAFVLLQPNVALADTSYFAGGNFSFLEKQYLDLKYAGVEDVMPGFSGPDRLETVQVVYNPDRISFQQLVRTYWKYVNPTQEHGQFSEKGPQFRSAIWVSTPQQRAFVEDCMVWTR